MQFAKQFCRHTCELILYSSRALHGRSALENLVQLESTFLMVDMIVSSEIFPSGSIESCAAALAWSSLPKIVSSRTGMVA